jgi:L-lactate utilization protein LutB
MELINSEEGVFNCTAVGYCSEVCPKHVDPANAVNQNKTNAAADYFLRFLGAEGRCQVSKRRPYVRSMDGWWRKNPFFVEYMIHEGTALFVAAYAGVSC